MAETNTVARSMHDIGLAAWFGGSLMGAIGVNGAASEVDEPSERTRVANAGWGRWTPVNLAAIAVHLIGGAIITSANKGRTVAQQGVGTATTAKTAVTVAALAATAYSRILGQRIMNAGDVPSEGGTSPSEETPPEVERAQRQLNLLQWMIPGLTGTLLVMNAKLGEQQRPKEVLSGIAKRILPNAA